MLTPTVDAQKDVGVMLEELGRSFFLTGEAASARKRFEESLAIRDRNAAGNPASLRARRDVILCHVLLARTGLADHWRDASRLAVELVTQSRAPEDQDLLEWIRKEAAAAK